MPNWRQLVEYTAEHTPGPWVVHDGWDEEVRVRYIHADRGRENAQLVAEVEPTAAGQHEAGPRGAVWVDPEQLANAKLIANAPELLDLVAESLNLIQTQSLTGSAPLAIWMGYYARASELMHRHVRLGIAGLDGTAADERTPGGAPADAPTVLPFRPSDGV